MAPPVNVKTEHSFPDKTLLISCPYCWNGHWSTGHKPGRSWGGVYDEAYDAEIKEWSEEVCPVCQGKANIHVYPTTKEDPWLICTFCRWTGRSFEPSGKDGESWIIYTSEPCRICHGLTFTFFSKKNPLVDTAYTGETKRLHPLD